MFLGRDQEILCSVCLFAFDPPLYDHVRPHIAAARQALEYLRRSQASATPVVGALNPNLGKHLDTLAPPRPALALLSSIESFRILIVLLDDLDSAVALTEVGDWMSIEEHFLKQSKRQDVCPYIRSLHQVIVDLLSRFLLGIDC